MGAYKNRIIGSGEESLDNILFNPRNWRIHPLNQQDALKGVLEEVGWVQQVIINKRTGNLIDGHLRCQLAAREGNKTIPVLYVDIDEAEEELVLATLDPIGAMAATDKQKLDELFAGIESENENVRKMMDEIAAKEKLAYGDISVGDCERGGLNERFIIPPFSIFDTRQGYWQERKQAWLSLGIESDEGRDAYAMGDAGGFKGSTQARPTNVTNGLKPSMFDPVLCEVLYRWFCPVGGLVINPMAGESVYGLVASYLGYRYKGVELREEQIDANRKQNTKMGLSAEWILGDGQDVYSLVGEDADMIMCCPPYVDLEVYSNDPRDLSTMEYEEFLTIYRNIIGESVRRLKNNRFAAFVVGDVRDNKGNYRNFVSETIKAFIDAGCSLYNEGVLLNRTGTIAMQVSHNFPIGRKFGKMHQNVLVFLKGDWREAVKACGDVEVSFPNE